MHDGPGESPSLFEPPRPDFLATLTPEEDAAMGAHARYAAALFEEGRGVFSGAALDGGCGGVVFRAGSPREAEDIFRADPAVRPGVVRAHEARRREG